MCMMDMLNRIYLYPSLPPFTATFTKHSKQVKPTLLSINIPTNRHVTATHEPSQTQHETTYTLFP